MEATRNRQMEELQEKLKGVIETWRRSDFQRAVALVKARKWEELCPNPCRGTTKLDCRCPGLVQEGLPVSPTCSYLQWATEEAVLKALVAAGIRQYALEPAIEGVKYDLSWWMQDPYGRVCQGACVVLAGPVGTGKTRALALMARAALSASVVLDMMGRPKPRIWVRAMYAPHLDPALGHATGWSGERGSAFESACDCDLLLLDDADRAAGRFTYDEALVALLSFRRQDRLATVLTAADYGLLKGNPRIGPTLMQYAPVLLNAGLFSEA